MNQFPISTLALVAMLISSALVDAGEYNSVLSVGDPAPSWSALPATDGRSLALRDFAKSDYVVVVFTCNSCPYAIDAEDRLIELQKDYADKSTSVVAINVNKVEEDLMPAMKEKAAEKSFPFPYLFDESQQIAKDFGAKYTPQVFLLDRERQVIYMGSIDDSPDGRDINQSFLRDALDAAIAGEQVSVSETVPIGCRIRLERQRRSR